MNCLNCNKETLNPKFCSRSCSAILTNKLIPKRKTKKTCLDCGILLKSCKKSRCEVHQKIFLETRFDFIKELTLADYWSKKSLENLHVSSKNAHIRILGRNQFKHLLNKPCAKCGYDKHVEICHIRAIKDFPPTSKVKEVNDINNVIQLCPNCHWEFDNLERK